MYRFDFDNGTGILRVKMTGFWTVEIAKRYLSEAVRRSHEARRAAGSLKFLVDATEHPAQTPDVLDCLCAARVVAYQEPNDRVAIALASAAGRNQVERTIAGQHTAVFASVPSARAWLNQRAEAYPAHYLRASAA